MTDDPSSFDSPSFDILPGAGHSPVILHVPHSAREIPPSVRAGIVLDDDELARELDHITDAHTAQIAEAAAGAAGVVPWRFVNRLSRLVVDPERFPDDREEMRAVGMGAVYTRTTHGAVLRSGDVEAGPLVARYFLPYARAMTRAVADRLAATGRAVIVDVHSYPRAPLPYELHGRGPGRRCASAPTPSTPLPGCWTPRGRPSGMSGRRSSTAPSGGPTCRWSSTGPTRASRHSWWRSAGTPT
ncbi:hypothetical protein STAFG_2640 [Streptomyces afghaniensis 772]|uniref:N-formylglutamate amidohydrolase n=1 Tax=Streptomyces afghaniensis 772 TaxID=1283301 RepID=S4MUE9_9ACTN|nr:hypothetical protein STAFG_2640 [Streptomyces afghaniensis 772]